MHELIVALAGETRLPEMMRGLAGAPGANPREYLADQGIRLPAELDVRVETDDRAVTVVATYRDEWFPAVLSWSAAESFSGRIVNNSWRHATAVPAAEGE